MVLTKAQRDAAKAILTLVEHHEIEGRKIAEVFEELPPRKDLPDYYKVISKPMALGLIRNRAKNGKYAAFAHLLRDLAQIFHNAKTYNVKKSIIYSDAVALEELLNAEVMKLKEAGTCDIDRLPMVGNLPTGSDEEDDDDDDDDNVKDEAAPSDADDTQEPRAKKPRLSAAGELASTPADEGRQSPSASRKRGRPPRVETPDETRMKNILRAIKRIQKDGETIYEPFEKLPDAKEYPDYYEHIKSPMSIALVKKNLKRKVYSAAGIEVFLKDVRLIFTNAQIFNEDGSEIHTNAAYMLEQMEQVIKLEVGRPDADFVNLDHEKYSAETGGMVKLARKGVDRILQRGESYAIGDWIYIENTNQPAVPIIAQIFKTWQNSNGEYWINACWYYRPHQTVHRADKLWFEQEVVKTGQYRDHAAQEIAGHCYVMYVTKYVRGRPKEWNGTEENLYVCEARYNEDLKTYNKIKAWKSCVPDESREESSNYELVPFPEIRHFPKLRSPLLHLLPEDKSLWVTAPEIEDKPVKAPEPNNRGSTSAPPIEGNVIITPVIPDEELAEINGARPAKRQTPEPPVISPIAQVSAPAPAAPQQLNQTPAGTPVTNGQYKGPPNMTPSAPVAPTPAPQSIQNLYASTPLSTRSPQFSLPQQSTIANPAVPKVFRPTVYQAASARSTPRQSATAVTSQPPMPVNTNKLNSLGSQVNPTAYIFPNSLGLPAAIKDQLLTDDKGEILWFTVPPQDPVVPYQKGRIVGHTARYLAWHIEKRQKAIQTEGNIAAAMSPRDVDNDVVMQES